jgi:hypothetical protein
VCVVAGAIHGRAQHPSWHFALFAYGGRSGVLDVSFYFARGDAAARQVVTTAGSGGVVICGFVAKPSAVRNRRLCLVPQACRGQHGHVCIRQRWVSDHPPERYSVVRQRQAYALSVPCVFPDYSALFTAIRRASSLLFRSHLLVWPQRNPNPPARNPETACRSK